MMATHWAAGGFRCSNRAEPCLTQPNFSAGAVGPLAMDACTAAKWTACYGGASVFGQRPRSRRNLLVVPMEERALLAQRELAARGHHRLALIDVMIAACAHEADAGVLHYDRNYDLIAEHTSLSFESVWFAPVGPCDCWLTPRAGEQSKPSGLEP